MLSQYVKAGFKTFQFGHRDWYESTKRCLMFSQVVLNVISSDKTRPVLLSAWA